MGKNFTYYLTLILSLAVLFGFSFSGTHLDSLSAAGSSTVFPLMTNIAKKYYDADVLVSGGGSSVGITKIKNGLINIGNASRYPKQSEVNTGWDDFRTFTVGADALTVVVKLPAKCVASENDSSNLGLVTFKWDKLYDQYAKGPSANITYDVLFGNTVNGAGCKTQVSALTRSNPGSSGTAEIFNLYLKHYASVITDQELPLEPLELVNDNETTAEANAVALTTLENRDHGITYLSLGFAIENIIDTSNNSILVSQANFPTETNKSPPAINPGNKDEIENGNYKWFRPLNSTININDHASLDFLKWWILGLDDDKENRSNSFWQILDNSGFLLTSAQSVAFFNQISAENLSKTDRDLNKTGIQTGPPDINKMPSFN